MTGRGPFSADYPFAPHYIEIKGARMHYVDEGPDDPAGDVPLLLINGATLPLEFWDPVAERLAERRRVVRFDQRNAGQSDFHGAFSLLDVRRTQRGCWRRSRSSARSSSAMPGAGASRRCS